MKLTTSFLVTILSLNVFAGELDTSIRCSGKTARGIQIGVDLKLDQVDRLLEMASFERDSVSIEDVSNLGARSIFLKLNDQGKIAMFGFKTYNDGMETNDYISYVAGAPSLSTLELGYRGALKAVNDIQCKLVD